MTISRESSLSANERPDDIEWMNLALEQAQEAARQGEIPVGCVVVANGELVATAGNAKESVFDPTGHAEIRALREAANRLQSWRLSTSTLYVTLEPCFMCAGAIVHARIPRVVFAARDPKAGAVGSLANVLQDSRLNHWCAVTEGIGAESSAALLKEFFRSRRKSFRA